MNDRPPAQPQPAGPVALTRLARKTITVLALASTLALLASCSSSHHNVSGAGSAAPRATTPTALVPNRVIGVFPQRGPVSPPMMAVAPDGRQLYVSNSANVSILDSATGAALGTIQSGLGSITGIALSPNGHTLYVSDFLEAAVAVMDVKSTVASTTIPVGSRPYGIALAPDGQRAYVSNEDDGSVSVIDTATNTVIGTDKIPPRSPALPGRIPGSNPTKIVPSPDGRTIYVLSAEDGSDAIVAIDTQTNTTETLIPISDTSGDFAISPDGRQLFVTAANGIDVINASTGRQTSTIALPESATGVAITPNGQALYVATSSQDDANAVDIIDIAQAKVLGTISLNTEVSSITVAPDSRRVYLSLYPPDGTDSASGAPGTAASNAAGSIVVLGS